MLYLFLLLVLALAAAGYLGTRLFFQKRGLKALTEELREVQESLGENRILTLPSPDRTLENLLIAVNELLTATRQEILRSAQREASFKAQVEYISHDLRTPLTSLKGYLSFIKEEELKGEGREALDVIKRKVGSLETLVARFYELSLLENREPALSLQAHDVGRVVRESALAYHSYLEKRGLAVSVALPDHAVIAVVDGDALERICANLLQNASRYAQGEVRLELKETEEFLRCCFTNDLKTEGMTQEEAERLFVPFYTGIGSRTSQKAEESSGLGLSIARTLAELMGARLEAHVQDGGRRISFVLTLPRPLPGGGEALAKEP